MRDIGQRFLDGLRDHLQPNLARQKRHPRGSRRIPLEPQHAFVMIPLLPPPDRRLRHARPPHDLDGALTKRRRQHDICPPGELARRLAVAQQSLKLRAVGGAKLRQISERLIRRSCHRAAHTAILCQVRNTRRTSAKSKPITDATSE